MNSSSLVSVIMPAYNVELYIRGAIDSILNQTYQNLEILIYDDCSNDSTVEIIESYKDERIKLHKKEKNTGYTNSLIQGIKIAKGKYIARMDSDDISDVCRIEKQVQFLELNNDYGIIGSFVKTINTNGESQVWKYPTEDDDIRLFTIVNSPFAHPSVIMRKEILDQNQLNYSSIFEPCEDYKLWVDLLKFTKGKNLPEELLHYRLHPHQTIALRRDDLIEKSNKVRYEVFYDMLGLKLNGDELETNYYFFNEISRNNAISIISKFRWSNNLKSSFKKKGNAASAIKLIEDYWLTNLRTLGEYKFSFLIFLMNKSLLRNLSVLETLRFFIKCLLRYKVPQKV